MSCNGYTIPASVATGGCDKCRVETLKEGENPIIAIDWTANKYLCPNETIVGIASSIDVSALPVNTGTIAVGNDAIDSDTPTTTTLTVDATAGDAGDDGTVELVATTSKGQILKFCFKVKVVGCC